MRILVMVLASAALGACAKQERKAARHGAAPGGAPAVRWTSELIELLPAETQVVIGVDLGRIRETPLMQRLERYLKAQPAYGALAASCKLEPHGLVDQVVFGTGFGHHGDALIAQGHFEQTTFGPCVEQALTAKGRLETESFRGHTLYLHQTSSRTEVLAFAGPHRLIYGERDWVLAVLDGQRPRPHVLDAASELDDRHPGFFVVNKPTGDAAMPAHASGGFDVGDGIVTEAFVRYPSAADAQRFVARFQQARAMLSSFAKLDATQSGTTAHAHLEMTGDQVVSFGSRFILPAMTRSTTTTIGGPVGIRPPPPGP